MGMRADFLVSFERDELAALDRFFALFSSPGAFAVPSRSPELLTRALAAMQADIRKACTEMDEVALSELSVQLSLDSDEAQVATEAFKKLKVRELEIAFGDDLCSTEASVALWKMLDVISPIDFAF